MYKLTFIISIIFVVLLFFAPYFGAIETNETHPKSHIEQLIKTLREISIDLSYNINEEDGSNLLKHTEGIKFYKKRIISLFKDFLKGDEPLHCNNELKHLSHLFAIHSIHY